MIGLYFVLALVLVLVGHAFRLLRWEQFIRIYERPLRGQMLRGMAGGYALNFVLPFHLGDAFRAVYTGRRMKSGIGFALATVIMDRFLDVWFVAFGFIAFRLLGLGGAPVDGAARYYLVFSLLLVLGLVLVVALRDFLKKICLAFCGLFNDTLKLDGMMFFWSLINTFKDLGRVKIGRLVVNTLLMWAAYLGSYTALAAALTVAGPAGDYTLPARQVILAIGHSARDTFEMLHAQGVPMEPKPFSMGVRIEHRQADINAAQYGAAAERLPAADYSLSCHLPDGSSAYTFCMCPGGEVFAAASEAGGVCTNGMSSSRRDGENANAAVLVTLRPEDFPDQSTLGGMYWQRSIEQRAFRCGGGNYHAPAQLAGDFLAGRASTGPGRVQPTYRPGVTWCDLHDMLPARITDTLAQALPAFGRKLRGFDDPDTVLTAPETRSSSPVRIVRGEDRCSTGVPGLYPCGEGAGYAGGITSAAVDGLRCAECVIRALQNEA